MTTPDSPPLNGHAATPSPAAAPSPAAPPGEAERRLHPMSWLFVLLAQLRQFVLPLVALVFFNRRGDGDEWWPLVGVAALVAVSLWQYATYRYGVHGDALVVRSGLLERSLRVIPFARIHNVALQQSVLHRLFGVAEVRLESAGGKKPEAEMRVLKLADAMALEALVRRRGRAAAHAGTDAATVSGTDIGFDEPTVTAGTAESTVATAPTTTLLALPIGEVLRLGLVSNRGMVVIGGGVAALSQLDRRLLPNLFEQWGRSAFGWAGAHQFGPLQYALAAASVALMLVLLLRGLSVLLALLQYWGFTLSEHGRRLTVERGLLARWRTSASRRRIQAWTLEEGVLHRWLHRRSLRVDTAVADDQNPQRSLRELAPIATPAACDALIGHLLPHAGWDALEWRALPPGHWWRRFLPAAPWALIAAGALMVRFGGWGAIALLWLPWAAYSARQHARRAAYASNAGLIAVRQGWWTRQWRFAEIDKLQALQLRRSPMDRWLGTATLMLDTAGAGTWSPPLRIRFLPDVDARALHAVLAHAVARRPLRW